MVITANMATRRAVFFVWRELIGIVTNPVETVVLMPKWHAQAAEGFRSWKVSTSASRKEG